MTGLDLLDDKQRALYIDGTWREANSGDRFDVHDPADGSVITAVADAAPTDAMDALDAAAAAQHDWARTPPRERGEILRRAFGLLTAAGRRLRAPDEPRDGQDRRRGARAR